MQKINKILNKRKDDYNKEDIINLLKVEGKDYQLLKEKANQKRKEVFGSAVHLRGIIEFSNKCKRNCYYCGLREENKKIERYELTVDEIIENAINGIKLGYKTIVLQSGENEIETDKMEYIIQKLKNNYDIALTLCVGERDYNDYKIWKEAGADRYLLKIETTDQKLYKRIHPDLEFKNRKKILNWLNDLGYQVGSGNIIGLPGQSIETIAEDILFFRKLDLDMIGIGPFISHPNTPFKNYKNGKLKMSIKALAVTRHLMPQTHLPATTALGTLDNLGRQKALKAGANVVMPNITDTVFRKLYEIYPSKICVDEKAVNCRECIGGIISSLGRTVAQNKGDSLKI